MKKSPLNARQRAKYQRVLDRFDDNVKEVVRNMNFTIEVSRY